MPTPGQAPGSWGAFPTERDTPLVDRDEQTFQTWYADRAQRLGLSANPDDPQHFYDYRAAFRAGAEPDHAGHWPSTFKREGHPRLIVDGLDTRTGQPPTPTDAGWPGLPPDASDPITDATARAAGTPAEQAARVLNLQLKTGLPVDFISGNLELLERDAAAVGFDAERFRRESPRLASWLEQHPLHTALVQDDMLPLTAMERTFQFAQQTVRRAAAGLYKGFDLGAWSAMEAAGDLLGLPALTALGKRLNEDAAATAVGIRGGISEPRFGPSAEAALSGFESIGMQTPIMAGALLTGGSSIAATSRAGLVAMGTQTGGQAYSQARAAGRGPVQSLVHGASQGLVEAWTETIPFSRLVGDIAANTGLIKTLMRQLGPEIAGEQIATALQDINDWVTLHPERSLDDYVRARPAAFVQTAIATIVATGVQTGTFHTLGRLASGPATEQAITQLGQQATAAGVTTASPAKLEELVAHITQDSSVETFYQPLDTWNTYWQDQGEDPRAKAADVIGSVQPYDDATVTGEPLPIPAARYTATLAATEHNAFFAKELKLAPELMNARETAELLGEGDDVRTAAATKAAPAAAGAEPVTPRQQIRQALINKLVGGGKFSVTDAANYAALMQAGVGTMAEAAGVNPFDAYSRYGLDVARPDLAQLEPPAPAPEAADTLAPASQAAAPEAIVTPDEGQATPPAVPVLEAPGAFPPAVSQAAEPVAEPPQPPPAEEPVAPAPEEAQTAPDGTEAPIPKRVDESEGGPAVEPGDTGESAGRPGDARAHDLAGEQPITPPAARPEPDRPRPDRKRRPAARRSDDGRRARAPRPGAQPGAGAGALAPAHVDTADTEPDADVAAAAARGEQPRHFVIDNTATLTAGTWQDKLADNLAAIRLLKALTAEHRPATDAEQAVLARYIGWGHTNLAPIVDPRAGALRERDPRLQKARDDLEAILTPKEMAELFESTGNAHYSFSDLPRAMWTALERLGFAGGIILEPAVGTGHFYGTMPGPILAHKNSRLWAVEKEPIAAAIAQQLYQGVHVQNSPLQEANLPDDYFDVVISNVPFGRIPIFDPAFTSAKRAPLAKSVHNYYFGKALDLVRPGGIVAFVTSRYTMDARSDVVRRELAARADLLGAVRLPDTAFRKTAGTDVVTDILFLRKREPGAAPAGHPWVQSLEHEDLSTSEKTVHTNQYFQANPSHVLGTEDMSGSMARTSEPQYNVTGTVDVQQLVDGLAAALPAAVYTPSKTPPRTLASTTERDVKQGSLQLEKDGKVYFYDKGTLVPSGLAGVALERATLFIPLRDAYQRTLDVMMARGSDVELKAAQTRLLELYKRFVHAHGFVNLRENRRLIELDPNGGRVLALEDVELVKVKGKQAEVHVTGLASFFNKRTIVPATEATSVETPALALTQSLAWKGAVDLPYMQGLTGQSETDLLEALEGDIFQDPVTHAWYARDEYLSGDVTTKLAQAEAAVAQDTRYSANVAALTAVLPQQFGPEDFPAPFGATWVPTSAYEAFVRAETKAAARITLVNSETRVKYYVDAGYGEHEFLPQGVVFGEWIADALNNELPVLRKAGETKGSTVIDVEATELYRESLVQLRERWAEWWVGDPAVSEQLTKIYNGMFNRDTPYVADGSHIVLPNANPAITLRPWQKNGIWRVLQQGNTLLAHAVGAGKTYAMIGIAGEWKRQGLAQKPLIVVPNHLVEQWRRDFLYMYPGARVLVPTKEDFTPSNRKRLIARIANNDWDAVVMAASQFLSVSVKLETLRAFMAEQEAQLLADGSEQMNLTAQEFDELVTSYGAGEKAATQALSSRNAPRSVKDIARAILTMRARFQKRLNQSKKSAPVTFEELGTDALLIDEAHLYKNLYFSTSKNNIAGLKGSDADRAMDMFLKVRQINQTSNGRNVVFATGTPVSNAISELYTMFRYLAQPDLDRMGMAGFDSWANSNAEAVAADEPAPGGGYKERTRLRKWSNLRELSAQFRRFSDVITTSDLLASGVLKLPGIKNGTPTVVALDAHPAMPAFMESLRARLEALKTGKVDKRDDNHLLITTQAGLASIDLRLVQPGVAEDPKSRINVASREIAQRYRASAATKGVQIVFLDVGIPPKKSMPPLPASLLGTAAPAAAVPEVETEEDEAAGDLVDLEADADEAMSHVAAAGTMRDLYGDLRAKLVARGIKDDEIAYVHQATNAYEQGKLYAAVKSGKVRVLLASTSKGATGMNVQDKLVALHHLDVPWRPADMEQREGRILRQGNENADVDIVRYVTKKSFDEYRWGLLVQKQSSIVQLMKGTLTSLDDIDPAQLDMMVAQALASGDPRTLDMLNKEREVKGLQTRFLAFTRKVNAARRAVSSGTELIERLTDRLASSRALVTQARAWNQAPTVELLVERPRSYGAERSTPRTFQFKDTDSRKDMQAAIEAILTSEPYQESVEIGTAGPYTLVLNQSAQEIILSNNERTRKKQYYITVKVPMSDGLQTLGSTPEWTVGENKFPDFRRSLDSLLALDRLTALESSYERTIAQYTDDVTRNSEIASKPFPQKDQLEKAQKELSAIRVALGIDRAPAPVEEPAAAGEEPPTVPAAAAPALQFDLTQREGAGRRGRPASSARRPLEFAQPERAEQRRGNIQFTLNPDTGLPQTIINLLTGADLSTFLHETGHFFLEVFGDMAEHVQAIDPATRTPEQTRLLDDWDALLREFNVRQRSEIGEAQHEHFAGSFERYLRAGQAPSVELRPAFARFRQWLLGVYRALRAVPGRPLSPELHGIFDRMLASEQELAQVDAERRETALLTTPEDVGMSPQRFAIYRERVEEASRRARERIDQRIARDVQRRQAAALSDRRADIEATVTADVQAQPVYQALAAITTGTKPDGSPLGAGAAVPLQLSRAALEAQIGIERTDALPAGVVSETEGTDPELVAGMFGFSSADELATAIETAPPIATAIRERVDAELEAAQQSLLTDGTLYEEAQDAAADEAHDAVLREEIKALWVAHEQDARAYERRWLEAEAKLRIAIAEGRKQAEIDTLTQAVSELKAKTRTGAATIRRALPSPEALRHAAQQRIARTKVRDLNPNIFWVASRQGARIAVEHAARDEFPEAIAAKTQELTNLAFFREARRAKAEVNGRRGWVVAHDSQAQRQQTGLAGQDYLDQWDGMLDRYEFKRVSLKTLDRRDKLADWIEAQRRAGMPIILPPEVLNDAGRTNYQTLTVEEFLGVTDGLKSLLHFARLKLELLEAKELRAYTATRDALVTSIRTHTPPRPKVLEFGETERRWRAIADGIASHATLGSISYVLDGHAYTGVFWNTITRRANEAADTEETRNQAAATAYTAILEQHYPGRQRLALREKMFIPAIDASLSKEARLALAMNWGNQSSRDRVLADPDLNWSREQVQAVLDTLDANDWTFVQDHWDFLETFWPEIAAKSERLTGLAPEKVEPLPVVTPFGTFRGGYHPLLYDSRKGATVARQEAVTEARYAVAGAYMAATTRRGHEITRKENVQLPLRLDFAATTQHIAQVIHDLTHHEMLIDVQRLLRDKAVSAAIHETQGDLVYGKLGRLFNDIATGDRVVGRLTMAEKGATWMRTRSQIAGLGWNLWSMLQQPLGIFNGMERVGVTWVAKGARRWARDAVHLENTVHMIADKSTFMRGRWATATPDLHDLRHALEQPGGWFDRLVRTVTADHVTQQTFLDSYMWFIAFGQRFADVPTWIGAYEKQLAQDPTDDVRAIAAADQAVIDSQGGGQIKDLAEVQRGGPVAKLFMTFASYGVTVLNASGRAVSATDFKKPSEVLTLLGHLSLLYAIPALFTEALRCGVNRAHCDEVPQFLGRVGGQMVSTALNGMIYVREATTAVNIVLDQETGPRGYTGTAGTRVFEVMTQLAQQIHQGELDAGLAKAAFQATGMLFRYPAAQVQRSIDGFIALEEGRTSNPLAVVFGPPPKKAAR